jgi:hypothetical protein
MMAQVIERFWDKAVPEPTTGCWLWTGYTEKGGYGRFNVPTGRKKPRQRTVIASRFAWELVNGPVPAGMEIDHACDTPSCINPEHLRPMVPWRNTLRGNGPAAQNARKIECKRGHGFTPENTLITRCGRRVCLTCSRIRCKAFYRSRKQVVK